MKQLRFVGPGDDGVVILETMDGEKQFRLPIDDTLRAALRPESPESGALPSENGDQTMTDLRPRDIQTRVRSGEDPAAIAAEAGTSLERVMRFAYPVLQERVRVVDEARRSRARGGSDGVSNLFGELFDARLIALGTEPTSVHWDSFRRPDGGWTITSVFTARETELTARFSFVLANRSVSALNEVAADLLAGHPIAALHRKPASPEFGAHSAGTGRSDNGEADEYDTSVLPSWPAGEERGPRLVAVPTAEFPDSPAASPNGHAPAASHPFPASGTPGGDRESRADREARTDRESGGGQRQDREHERRSPLRLPGRRQKAHTHPIPVRADEMADELFDQEALEPSGWHEPPLPLDLGPGIGEQQQPTELPTRMPESAPQSAAEPGLQAAPDSTPEAAPQSAPQSASQAASESEPQPASAQEPAASDETTASAETTAPAAGTAPSEPEQHTPRRAGKSGEKPRMPSWDDILLGVRRKSE